MFSSILLLQEYDTEGKLNMSNGDAGSGGGKGTGKAGTMLALKTKYGGKKMNHIRLRDDLDKITLPF